ncbi:MAG: UbiA family prenyltransferase [Acidiferrobacterales bacterium]
MKQPENLQTLQSSNPGSVPLCVDLDGTLIKTDILIESLFALLKRGIFFALLIPFWLLRGKAYLKEQIAARVELDVDLLPYNERFLGYLREQHGAGRPLVLATASHAKFAHKIAEHLGLFTHVLGSDDQNNLSGSRKLEQLRDKFGEQGFDYAGNSRTDLKIWPHARQAILVNPAPGVRSAAERVASVGDVFDEGREGVRGYLRAIRIHQWLKNFLVFVPLVADHQVDNPQLVLQALLGFVAFCLCASSVYLLNDMLDLPADRQHPRKRRRPFAAGTVSIKHGALLIPVLLFAALGITPLLPVEFVAVLATYYVSTLAYSMWLKGKVVVDVLVLAGLYTLRVIAGAAATSIPLSFWLLAFAMFIFLSLSMVKRYSELLGLQNSEKKSIIGRGYEMIDLPTLISLGAASGYTAVLVLALYINSEEVREQYTRPEAIWLICPLLLYWVSLVWVTAGRGKMHDDPVVFAIKHRGSQCIGLLVILILLLAS